MLRTEPPDNSINLDYPLFRLEPPLNVRLKAPYGDQGEIVLWAEVEEGILCGYDFPTMDAAQAWYGWLAGTNDRALEREFLAASGLGGTAHG